MFNLPQIVYPSDDQMIACGRRRHLINRAEENEVALSDCIVRTQQLAVVLNQQTSIEDQYEALQNLVAAAANAREKSKYALAYRAEIARLNTTDQQAAA